MKKEERQVNIYELSADIGTVKRYIHDKCLRDPFYKRSYRGICNKYYDFILYCDTCKEVLEELESLFSHLKTDRLNKFYYCKVKV